VSEFPRTLTQLVGHAGRESGEEDEEAGGGGGGGGGFLAVHGGDERVAQVAAYTALLAPGRKAHQIVSPNHPSSFAYFFI
jgi:hypothetical protein